MTGSRLRANLLWNYAGGVASAFGLVLLFPVAAGAAGAADYGLWVLAFSAIQLFSQLDLGLGTGVVRMLARSSADGEGPTRRRGLVWVSLAVFSLLGLVLGVIFVVGFGIYARALSLTPALRSVVPMLTVVGAVSLCVAVIGRGANSVLWAEDRLDIERKGSLVGLAVRAGGLVVVLAADGGLRGVVLVEAVATALPSAVCLTAVFRRYGVPHFVRADLACLGPLVRTSLVLFVGSLSALVALQLPVLVVGATESMLVVTAFGALMRVHQSVRLLISWTTNPFTARIADLRASGHELGELLRTCAILTLSLALVIAVPTGILANDVLVAWMGEEFAFAGRALTAIGISGLALALILPTSLVANLRGRPWDISIANIGWLAGSVVGLTIGARTGGLLALTVFGVTLPLLVPMLMCIRALRRVDLGPAVRIDLASLLRAVSITACVVGSATMLRLSPLDSWARLVTYGLSVVVIGGALYRRPAHRHQRRAAGEVGVTSA